MAAKVQIRLKWTGSGNGSGNGSGGAVGSEGLCSAVRASGRAVTSRNFPTPSPGLRSPQDKTHSNDGPLTPHAPSPHSDPPTLPLLLNPLPLTPLSHPPLPIPPSTNASPPHPPLNPNTPSPHCRPLPPPLSHSALDAGKKDTAAPCFQRTPPVHCAFSPRHYTLCTTHYTYIYSRDGDEDEAGERMPNVPVSPVICYDSATGDECARCGPTCLQQARGLCLQAANVARAPWRSRP